jgi:signal transduction histidine kinase
LFAGRTLRRLVRGSLRRPSPSQLEAMLRGPLGDPHLTLRFWDAQAGAWDGAIEPRPGAAVTVIERDSRPAVALIHDRQLADDPELLQAAGAVALLAAENADLDAAVDNERRRVAHDLHDGVQQRLTAIRLRLSTTADLAADSTVRERLDALGESVDEVVDDVREVAHGLYPHLLRERGVVVALAHALGGSSIDHNDFGRHPPQVESAIFYCCLEAVQNARKHGDAETTARITIRETDDQLSFVVADDGPGFDPDAAQEGIGLRSLHHRMGAVGGRLQITSQPGRGTSVAGFVPLSKPAGPHGGFDRETGGT